jgi:cyclomaltodextrinase / maltogenic alpha-amylase / neopullulanase
MDTLQQPPAGPDIPKWLRDAVIYQIFPERFKNGDPTINPDNVCPWDSQPTFYNFMGGDLQGIIDKVRYLKDLGVNAIYLNPIFWASSNHKYNPYDFYRVDPRFGTMDLFIKLLDVFHENGLRVILDGVFNHCGRGFFPFFDVMENRNDSDYIDWFYIDDLPVNAYGDYRYKAWNDLRSCPKLKVTNRATRKYLLDVAAFWTKKGLDGWRLDAASDIEDDSFWKEFREDASPWLMGDQFDGVTNYAFRGALIDFFLNKSVRAEEFARRMQTMVSKYPASAVDGMYNLLGSHDTPRIYTVAGGNITRIKLAVFFQFLYRGLPAIYYGDENGMEGGGDPDNRRAMLWDESKWNLDIRETYRKAINLRKDIPSLRYGDWHSIFSNDQANTCAFLRRTADDFAIIIFNNGSEPATINISLQGWNLPERAQYIDKVRHQQIHYKSNELELSSFPPEEVAVLVPS